MAENQLPIVGGRDVPSIKVQSKEGLEGLKQMLSSVFSKGDKAARATLGPAAAPVEGLLSLFDLRNVPQALETAGKDLQRGATEGDPKAILAGVLGTALVGAEGMPQGRAVNRITRRPPVPEFKTESEKEFYEIIKKDLPSISDNMPLGPINTASRKKNKEGLLVDEDGNPVVVYHSTRSVTPFPEFDLKEGRYGFLSTSTQPRVAENFGLASNDFQGGRLIPGMVKAKKTFDFENVKDSEDILNKFSENITKEINDLDDALEKLSSLKTGLRPEAGGVAYTSKIKDYIDPNLLDNDQKQMVIWLHTQNDIPMRTAIRQFVEENKKELNTLSLKQGQFASKIKKGDYSAIEEKKFLETLQKEGYDSFTTSEAGGKNIMLFEPDKQFIPLYDTEKTSKIGYQKGGSIVERNPYNYKPRAI